MFSTCLFGFFVSLSRCLSSCAMCVSRTHDVVDDVTMSQGRSNFEINIYPSIFELEGWSKTQNIGNANDCVSNIFNVRYHFRWKSLSRAQNGGHFENFEILNTASVSRQIWKDRPKLCHKNIFHHDDVTDEDTGWPKSLYIPL